MLVFDIYYAKNFVYQVSIKKNNVYYLPKIFNI